MTVVVGHEGAPRGPPPPGSSPIRKGFTLYPARAARKLGIVLRTSRELDWAAAVISDSGFDGFSYAAVAVWV